MRLLRLILGLFITLLVLLVVAALVLPKMFNPNDYREQITQLVKDKTSRDITIDGDLELSVFPWLGVSTGRLTVSQPNHLSADFGGGNMLEVDASKLRLKILPLIKSIRSDVKDIQVDTIVLNKPFVELITTKRGVSSLDGLTGDTEPVEKEKSTSDSNANNADGKELAAQAGVALVVQGVDLDSARLIWDDRQSNQRYEVRNLTIKTGNLLGRSAEPVSMSGELLQGTSDQAGEGELTSFSLDADARVDVNTLAAMVENLTAKVEQNQMNVELGLSKLSFDNAKHVQVENLNTKVSMQSPEPIELNVNMPMVRFYHNHNEAIVERVSGTGQFQQSPLSFDLNDIAFNLDKMAGSTKSIAASINLIDLAGFKNRKLTAKGDDTRFNLSSERVSIKSLNINSEGIEADIANIQGYRIMSDLAARASLNVKTFNLLKLLKQMEIDYAPANAQALSELSLSAEIDGGLNQVKVSKLKLNIDESQLRGNVAVRNFTQPNAEFDITLNQLNVDDYIPLSDDTAVQESSPDAGGLAALFTLFPIFEQYKANGQFIAGSLQASGLQLNDIEINAKSNAVSTDIASNAQLYGGSYRSQIRYESLNNGGRLKFSDTQVNKVDIGDLLTDADVTDQIKGTGSLDVNVAVEQVNGQQSSQGEIGVELLDGAIKGVDIQKILRDANNSYNKLKGRELEEQNEIESETKFASLTANFDLKDSILSNNDLDIKAPLFRVGGAGVIDIEPQTLDYTVKVSVVNSIKGQGGDGLEKLKGVTLPVRFYGPLTNPRYKVDLKALFKSAAQEKINEKKDEYLKEKLGIEGGGSLSSKDILKAAVNRKIQEKYGNEEPATERVDTQNEANQSQEAQQVPQQQPQEQPQQQPVEKPKTKEEIKQQLKDDLKRKALEKLFG